MLWKYRQMSTSFATTIKHWGPSEKRRLQEQAQEEKRIAVACADAETFLNKHCPAQLVGMLRKTPALPGLSPVAESIFTLQRKWANCLCHYQNAAATSGSSSLLKFSSWKARSKEAVVWNHCIIILVHKADTCFSASVTRFLLQTCLWCKGCPEKGALQSVWCICQQEPSPPHKNIYPYG